MAVRGRDDAGVTCILKWVGLVRFHVRDRDGRLVHQQIDHVIEQAKVFRRAYRHLPTGHVKVNQVDPQARRRGRF